MPDDLRERIAAALNDSEDACARCQHCDRQLNALMSVRDGELIRLRNRIAALEENGAELLRRTEKAEAELAEIKRVTDPPANDDEMPTDPAELREMWEFINRQARWQWHMAHKFGEQVERLRAELAENPTTAPADAPAPGHLFGGGR